MSEEILSLVPPDADRRVCYGPDANQFIDLRFPKSGGLHPLAIMIHGGFWRAKYDLVHTGHMCAALAARGVVSANLEYRRVGNEGGGWPNTILDIRAAYSFLRDNAKSYDLDSNKVVVVGHSAGAQLALCLAAEEPAISGVISLAGVIDLQRAYEMHLSNDAVVEFLRGKPFEVPDYYRAADPMQLTIAKGRQVVVHGTADPFVPPDFSRDYVARKKGTKEQVELLEIADADHFDLIDPRRSAWMQVEREILKLLSRNHSTLSSRCGPV